MMADLGNEWYTPSPFLDVLLQVIRNSRIFSNNVEKNTLIRSEAMAAGNLILSGIVTPTDRLVVQGMFTSMFKYMDYRKAARVLNVGMRLYGNPDYQVCLMYGFRAAHRIIY